MKSWKSAVDKTGNFARRMAALLRKSQAALAARRHLVKTVISLRVPSLPVSGRTAVVIAPHPDDETFGAGGMIALKRHLMARVDVIFLTSGEAAHNGCCEIAPEEVARVRRDEAVNAAERLGLDAANLHWLGLNDGAIPSSGDAGFRDAVAGLNRLLLQLMPEEIFCPHPFDPWPDHCSAGELAQAAYDRYVPRCDIIFYLVWPWYSIPVAMLQRLDWSTAWRLDISSVLRKKQQAIESYLSNTVPYCGHPYCGRLPKGFIGSFSWPNELFFSERVVRAVRPITTVHERPSVFHSPVAAGEE